MDFFAEEIGFTIQKTTLNLSSINFLCDVQNTFKFYIWVYPRPPNYTFYVKSESNSYYSKRELGKVPRTYHLPDMKKNLISNIKLNLLEVMNL